jgi:hypothetical protein
MNAIKDFQKIKEYFDVFEEAIKNNDNQLLINCFSIQKSAEESFLRNYYARKKEGVYYTNEDIVKFMISEVLILFLNKKLKSITLDRIEDLYDLEPNLKKSIIKILENITICDPACGSGVFLISVIKFLFNLIKKLDSKINHEPIKIKILQNIYGFDINEYAIKFCMLKLCSWFYSENNQLSHEILSIIKANIKVKNSLKISNPINFDIIIGNPPYGNIISKEEKEFLRKEKIFYKDIYCTFILKSLEWSNGIIGLLVPKSFLLRQSYIIFRNKLLSSANFLKIIDIGSKLFKNATNEVQILMYENKDDKLKDLRIFDYPDKEIITYKQQNFDSLRICFNPECPISMKSKKIYNYTFLLKCPYCNNDTTKLNRIRVKPAEKIHSVINQIEQIGDLNFLNIKDFPKMIRGEEDKGLIKVKKLLRNDIKGTCFFINAKDDFKYYYIDKNKSFNIEEIDSKVLKGENYEYYLTPKLLIKHNNIIPEAIYSEDNVCFTSSIYSLLHDDVEELKYLSSILNSALIQFYCIYAINNQKDTTINLNQYMIRHLPIVKPDEDTKAEVAKRVDKITAQLDINDGKENEEVLQLYKEIDEIIFNLFSIEQEERKLIKSIVSEQIDHFKKLY